VAVQRQVVDPSLRNPRGQPTAKVSLEPRERLIGVLAGFAEQLHDLEPTYERRAPAGLCSGDVVVVQSCPCAYPPNGERKLAELGDVLDGIELNPIPKAGNWENPYA
jgi:hypothetical protein